MVFPSLNRGAMPLPRHNPPRQRRVNVMGVLGRSGGPLGILVMSLTLGGLILLLIIQGSFFWSDGDIMSENWVFNNEIKEIKKIEEWETQRKRLLESVRTSNDKSHEHICNNLPSHATSKSLWIKYIGAIIRASQHPDDPNFIHETWTKQLLSTMTPSSLHRTFDHKSKPEGMSRILDIIRRRLQHPDKFPPLRIAVVGGTFSEGEGCSDSSIEIPEASIMANPSFCAWPYRLEAFLNSFILGSESKTKWVEITNMSEEGTDTGFMIPLMRNWIYPKHLLPHGPDIIINSYGSYDYETYGEGSSNLKQTIYSEMTTFLRAVEVSHPCGDVPMVIHIDDANIQFREGLGKSFFSIFPQEAFGKAIEVDGNRKFAMAGHLAMTWIVSFGMAEAVLRHCDRERNIPTPPEKLYNNPPENCQDPSTGDPSCPFSIFASPQGTVTRVTQFQKYLRPYLTTNIGWEVLSDMSTGWSRKTGLVAMQEGAQMVLEIKNITKEVRYFHLMTLKSNVDPWKTGKAEFRIALQSGSDGKFIQTSFTISGYHETTDDKTKHVTHHFNLELQEQKALVGSDIKVFVDLVEGTNFKILGLMLCS